MRFQTRIQLIADYPAYFGLGSEDSNYSSCYYGECSDGNHSQLCDDLDNARHWFLFLKPAMRSFIAEQLGL